MNKQHIGLFIRLGSACQGPPLAAILRILHRILVRDLGLRQSLDTNAQPRCVHHDEHCGQALVFLTHDETGRAIIVHHAGRVGVDPHFVFDRTARHPIARAQRAIVIHQNLGNYEQRDALGRIGRVGSFCQHQMDDVFGQIMFAGRNENLGSGNGIGTIELRHRAGADQAQISAALRLGQIHGAQPFVGNHFGEILGLLLGRALGEDGRDRPIGQAGVHPEGLVG